MARNPAVNFYRLRFAKLFARHLLEGTGAKNGERWTNEAFASKVQSTRVGNEFASPTSVGNWRNGKRLPAKIEPVLQAFPEQVREELRKAYKAALAEKNDEVIRKAKSDPAGGTWIPRDDQFALDRTVRMTDKRAAANPNQQQLQFAIRLIVEDLASRAMHLSNSQRWGGITTAVDAFRAVVGLDPLQVPERLGEAYALLLRIGRFLETDARVRAEPMLADGPLDPDIYGSLTDLVRTAAPWLRGFPTVAAMDDAAGKALVRTDIIQPVREFIRIARKEETISAHDADEVGSLAEAAGAEDFQGQKAAARAVGSAKNLLLASAVIAAAQIKASLEADALSRSILAQRVFASLALAEDQIEAIALTLPDDLRYALRALIQEGQQLGKASSSSPIRSTPRSFSSRDRFRDLEIAPEMVVVPAGEFIMGSADGEGGQYEHPVVLVSWHDAQAYVAWLRDRSGSNYRLLSEAEWEYCCRAGTASAYSTGGAITAECANFNEEWRGTTSVFKYPPNPWGLRDMHGNVWEWCQDNWHDNYYSKPATDGSVWRDNAPLRVIRGGSWDNLPQDLRSAYRVGDHPDSRSIVVGLRVARTL
ncbi:formylglycine-generating enzyme family protein [Bradyrhizobium sp. th.b2]|uniref:formylglycine-generating enzyme family protein n=1 Tax=Bradyrhizobium sp. th-b2 TaxID=172088 RepID=UPI0003F62130|nr:formylglycine-generating enzyme family protein [Bradyrhizobium sp. th.b2]